MEQIFFMPCLPLALQKLHGYHGFVSSNALSTTELSPRDVDFPQHSDVNMLDNNNDKLVVALWKEEEMPTYLTNIDNNGTSAGSDIRASS